MKQNKWGSRLRARDNVVRVLALNWKINKTSTGLCGLAKQPQKNENDHDYQDDVDKIAAEQRKPHFAKEPQQPQDQQNYDDSFKHAILLM